MAGAATAQDPQPYRRPGDERLPLPELGAPPEPRFELPPVPVDPSEPGRSDPDGVRVFVRRVDVAGSTIFPAELIAAWTAP
jgi:hypothetical protein